MRPFLGTLAGLVAGVVIIFVVEMLGHVLYPPPEGVDLKDPAQLEALMGTIPLGAKIAVLIAWGLGVFGGGAAAVSISGGVRWPAAVVAVVLLGFAAMTMIEIPHPAWMVAGALFATGAGWYGATRFAR